MKNTEGRQGTTVRDRHRRQIARDKPDCSLCGLPIDYQLKSPHPWSYEAHHVVPINRGGRDVLFNDDGTPQKVASHRSCNRTQSDRMPGEPAGRKRNAFTYVTHRCWW